MIVTHKRNKTQTTELITIAMNRKKKVNKNMEH